MVEDIILSVKGNALGVTEGIDEIDGRDTSVGIAARCYHRLKSYADSMHERKMGLLLDDGIERIDAMEGLMMAML